MPMLPLDTTTVNIKRLSDDGSVLNVIFTGIPANIQTFQKDILGGLREEKRFTCFITGLAEDSIIEGDIIIDNKNGKKLDVVNIDYYDSGFFQSMEIEVVLNQKTNV